MPFIYDYRHTRNEIMAAVLAALFLLATSPVHANEVLHTRSRPNINYRQDLPVGPSPTLAAGAPPQLPSNFWWPYPQTSTDKALSPSQIFSAPGVPSVTLGDAVTSSQSPFSDLVLSSTSPISSYSLSIISITALPPTNTSLGRTYPKLDVSNDHTHMKIVLPICIVVGVVLGAAVAWFAWGCFKRGPRRFRYTYTGIDSGKVMNFDGSTYLPSENVKWACGRRRRESELEVGPEYKALDDEDDDERHGNASSNQALPLIQQRNSVQSTDSRTFAWPSIEAVLTSPKSKTPSRANTSVSRSEENQPSSPAETDITSFLSPIQKDAEINRHPSRLSAPWESLRHKSIKRGILEEVLKEQDVRTRRVSGVQPTTPLPHRNQSSHSILDGPESCRQDSPRLMHRASHTRAHSDMHIEPLPLEVSRTAQSSSSERHNASSMSPNNSPLNINVIKSSSKGFRMIMESPPTIADYGPTVKKSTIAQRLRKPDEAPEASDGSISRALAWASTAFVGSGEQDKFTPAPGRQSRSRSPTKQSPHDSFSQGSFDLPEDTRTSRSVFRAILPQSPNLAFGSSQVDSQLYFSPSIHGSPVPLSPSPRDRSSKPVLRLKDSTPGRKLRSKSPPKLPFPSGTANIGRKSSAMVEASDVYRGRLTKKNPNLGKVLPVYSIPKDEQEEDNNVHDRVRDAVGRRDRV